MTWKGKGWLIGLFAIVFIFLGSINYFIPESPPVVDDPWAAVPVRPDHEDHTELMPGPYSTPQDVTKACVTCHEDAANQIIHTTHWTWESDPITLPDRDEPITTGKKNSINNFCIGIQGNWPSCSACHTGYGWQRTTGKNGL